MLRERLVQRRRAWQPTPGFLPGESHGQRSMAGYSPWGHTESDTTERLSIAHVYHIVRIYQPRVDHKCGCSQPVTQGEKVIVSKRSLWSRSIGVDLLL